VVAVQAWRSVLVAGHGGMAALLCGAPAITGMAKPGEACYRITVTM